MGITRLEGDRVPIVDNRLFLRIGKVTAMRFVIESFLPVPYLGARLIPSIPV
jgi:hypothetical protein